VARWRASVPLVGHASSSAAQRYIEGGGDPCDIVTQCRFVRHVVALRVGEPVQPVLG
jgi:hypothetical protein